MKRIFSMVLVFWIALSAFAISAPRGMTLNPINLEKLTDNALDDFGSSLFVDSFGKVHIAWAGGPDVQSDMAIYYAYKSATGWETEQVPKPPNSKVNIRPSLFVDSGGIPHIAWISNPTQQPSTGLWYGWDVWYAVRTGEMWTMEQITQWESENQHVKLFLDSLDNPHIAWDARYYYGLWGVHYATKIGGIWTIETVDNEDDAEPSLFVDSNGTPHMLWLHIHNDPNATQPGYGVRVGGNWVIETIQGLPGKSIGDGKRQLYVDQSGVPHIAVARQISYLHHELWYGNKTGGSWSFSQIRDSSVGNFWPNIFLDSGGTPYVAWMSNATGNYDPYLATMQDENWKVTQIGENLIEESEPSLFVDSSDNVHLAWHGPYLGSGASEIYYASAPQQVPNLSLTPDTGFSSTIAVGSGFSPNSTVTISWDNIQISTVPNTLTTNEYGNFSALISVPTQNDTGAHTVKAIDEWGNEANATFTVIDVTGPQGQKGDIGPQGPPGETREFPWIVDAFTIAASIIAICLATIALLRKKT